MREFDLEPFFPRRAYEAITDLRVSSPEVALESARARRRRRQLTVDGRLALLAANHPARMITSAAGDPLAMGDRYSHLGRILRILSVPGWDGVLGTADILEDLLIVDHLLREAGGKSLLDDRVLIASTNRGGLSGTSFELDDTRTSYDVPTMKRWRLDAAMAMLRLDPKSDGSLRTITSCAALISEAADAGLPVFLEPLPVLSGDDGYTVDRSPERLIRLMGVASGLGSSSLGTWIKIPFAEPFDRVAAATTCPILMLGGEARGEPETVLADFARGMASAHNVRGVLVGRNVLFPGSRDPFSVASAVRGIVHDGISVEHAERLVNTDPKPVDLGQLSSLAQI